MPQCEDDEGKSATCMCDKGWDGAACDCTKVGLIFTRFSACSCFHLPCYAKDTEPCKDAITGQVCFGRGRCECGRCKCGDDYEGKFCQREKDRDICEKVGTNFQTNYSLPSYINFQLEPCVKDFATKPEAMENIVGRE